ncbi:MAG: alpha/beta fold hydrolase [Pseudomonadota bacterium]|nr:alpha/beta fold hydrolase [Pseudomonadota bacterium]
MTTKTRLVLVPGLLCSETLWSAQIEALSDIVDIIVADMSQDDTIEGMANRVLDCVSGPFALAGLSMGGYVSLEVMRQAPNRVDRLALMGTSARADTTKQTARRKSLIQQADSEGFESISVELLPLLIHQDRLSDMSLVADITGMAASIGKEAFLCQQLAIMRRPDSRRGLSQINCPTLVVCGRQDVLTPPELSEEITALIPDADLILIEACGHLSTMERPEIVNTAMRAWLTS